MTGNQHATFNSDAKKVRRRRLTPRSISAAVPNCTPTQSMGIVLINPIWTFVAPSCNA